MFGNRPQTRSAATQDSTNRIPSAPFAFVSYARNDYRRSDGPGVEHYLSIFEAHKVPYFLDKERLGGAGNWSAELQKAIDRSACVAMFLSPSFLESAVCNEEIAHARAEARQKPCIPLFIDPVNTFNGTHWQAVINKIAEGRQFTNLRAFDHDEWIFPVSLQLAESGIGGLDKLTKDPRALRAPDPYDGLGQWHLGTLFRWSPSIVRRALQRARRRLEFGARQEDVNMGVALCQIVLKMDIGDAQKRLDAARSFFVDVAQTHFYAALAIAAYRPIGQLSSKEYAGAHERLDAALALVEDYRAALFVKAALQVEYAAAHRLNETGARRSDALIQEAAAAPQDQWECEALAKVLVLRVPSVAQALATLT